MKQHTDTHSDFAVLAIGKWGWWKEFLWPHIFSLTVEIIIFLPKKKDRKQVPTSARCDLSLCMLSHPLEANGLEISWSEDEVLDKYQIHTMNLSQFVLTTFYSLWCHDF